MTQIMKLTQIQQIEQRTQIQQIEKHNNQKHHSNKAILLIRTIIGL